MTTQILPTLFVPHGAGPCFFMNWTPVDTWSKMADWLRSVPELIGTQPKALLLISGHWEASRFTVNAQAAPPLMYDYSGFPPHTYDLEYAAPGSPELAAKVQAFPDADVPIVQLSLKNELSPAEHLAVGRALAPLRREGGRHIHERSTFCPCMWSLAPPAMIRVIRCFRTVSSAVCSQLLCSAIKSKFSRTLIRHHFIRRLLALQ